MSSTLDQIEALNALLAFFQTAGFITTKATYTSITQVEDIPDLVMDALILRVTLYISTIAKRYKMA